MNVLIIGSGGREHAIGWKIAQSNKLGQLFFIKGNAGTKTLGENIQIDQNDFESVGKFCLARQINMIVVGPEEPLVKGFHDYFTEHKQLKHIAVIGPVKAGARLEGSKEFAKSFMEKHNIPTAKFKSVDASNLEEGLNYLEQMQPPYVLKADGLAAGKGVLIIADKEKAKTELEAMLKGKFGEASKKVVIEEYLDGIELSVFVITDGDNYLLLPEAKDYKRIGESDTGLNTGGMGAISPVPFASKSFLEKVEKRIVQPTIDGLKKEQIPFRGFIFFGLMNKNGDPYVIEYNVRMGDPEAEVVIPRIENDFIDILTAAANKKLNEIDLCVTHQTAATVMLVSGGYPENYEKNKVIKGLNDVGESIVFHAGTAAKEEIVVTAGGRVLSITSMGTDMNAALEKSYKNAEVVDFEKKYFRKDIGFDLK